MVWQWALGPISVTMAYLVMEDMEQRALNTRAAPPAFWKCYMDSTFTVLPRGQFYDHFNSLEPTIKFTIEMEQEGSLPFLDTRVTHNSDGSLTTTVFTQKTHLDWYLYRLWLPPPSSTQGGSGSDTTHSGRPDLHKYPRHGCWEETDH